jgi:hypothetical protein
MTEAPRIVSIDLTHLVHAALAAQAGNAHPDPSPKFGEGPVLRRE